MQVQSPHGHAGCAHATGGMVWGQDGGAGRTATKAVSRPQGLRNSRILIRQRGLDFGKPLAPILTAAGQTQNIPGHVPLPLCSKESLSSSFPQDAHPAWVLRTKEKVLAVRKENIQAWEGICCSCTGKEETVGTPSGSIPSVSAYLHIRIQSLTENWPLLPAL